MPEFVGGLDSLGSFLKSNIIYPEWEKKNKIEGAVYISFVVEKDGKISNPEIYKTVKASKNFDTEVKRVISLMPNWKAGENKGRKVAVKLILPIRFKL